MTAGRGSDFMNIAHQTDGHPGGAQQVSARSSGVGAAFRHFVYSSSDGLFRALIEAKWGRRCG
ncbi:MAG: hypothetical protein U0802_22705 [Candidatus Binatia bacterium]